MQQKNGAGKGTFPIGILFWLGRAVQKRRTDYSEAMNLNTCNIIKFPIRLAWVLPGEGDLIWDPIGGFVMDMALEEDDEASRKKTNGTNQKKMTTIDAPRRNSTRT